MKFHGSAGRVFTTNPDGTEKHGFPVTKWEAVIKPDEGQAARFFEAMQKAAVTTCLAGTVIGKAFEQMAKAFAPLAKPLGQFLFIHLQSKARSQIKHFRKRKKWIERARGSNQVTTYFRYRKLNRGQYFAGKMDIMDYIANLGPIEILKSKSSLSPLPKSAFLKIG